MNEIKNKRFTNPISKRKFNIDLPEINYFDKKLDGQIEFRKKKFQKKKNI